MPVAGCEAAGPVLGLPDEEQGAGEAAEQGEEEEVGELLLVALTMGVVMNLM